MGNKILKCYDIVKFFLKIFEFKMFRCHLLYITVALVVYFTSFVFYLKSEECPLRPKHVATTNKMHFSVCDVFCSQFSHQMV